MAGKVGSLTSGGSRSSLLFLSSSIGSGQMPPRSGPDDGRSSRSCRPRDASRMTKYPQRLYGVSSSGLEH